MATEMGLKEIGQIILISVLFLVPSGAALAYLSTDTPKALLISHEIKNTLDLASTGDSDIEYTLTDENIRVSKENKIVKVKIDDVEIQTQTHSDKELTQNGKTISIKKASD